MHHLLRSQPLIAEYGARSKGIRPAQWDLPWDEFASIKVRLPHADTQRAIADYLDIETGRIDALISKKRRMIELLVERARSAVVERLGSLECRTVHLSHVARIYSGSGFPLSYQGNDAGDYPFFKVGDLASSKDGRWIDSAPNWVDWATARRLGCRLAPIGSVLFPKVGAALLGNRRTDHASHGSVRQQSHGRHVISA